LPYLGGLSEDQVFYLLLTKNTFETIGMISLFAFFDHFKNLETKWMNYIFGWPESRHGRGTKINKAILTSHDSFISDCLLAYMTVV
jgi:hypothetical protein